MSAALVTPEGGVTGFLRRPLAADAAAGELVAALLGAARAVVSGPADWTIALPGPFDYVNGVAHYRLGKFDSLNGFDLRGALAPELGGEVRFLNDADAFALGCWVQRRPVSRLVALTLGTGVGSGWVADGVVVTGGPEVPPEGSAYLLSYRDAPLETWVSRQAIRTAYAAAGGAALDVLDICELARTGDERSTTVLRDAMTVLGEVIAPWLQRFGAERLVIGGSIAASWDLLGPWFTAVVGAPAVEIEAETELAALQGAAWFSAARETAAQEAVRARS